MLAPSLKYMLARLLTCTKIKTKSLYHHDQRKQFVAATSVAQYTERFFRITFEKLIVYFTSWYVPNELTIIL